MDREGWPLDMFAEDVKAVVTHLDLDPVILVGHSMGGPVAVAAAGLLGERVLGVVGVDTFQNVEAKYDPEQMAQFINGLETDFPKACDRFVRGMFPAVAAAQLVDRIAGDMCSGPAEVGTTLMRQFVEVDMTAMFAGATVPIRAVNADLWPTNVEANRRHHDDFDAVIVEGTGHFLMMERPEAFNPVLAEVLLGVAHAGL
jgi:pimeloyl-ACP methyl ester carboxylesterase